MRLVLGLLVVGVSQARGNETCKHFQVTTPSGSVSDVISVKLDKPVNEQVYCSRIWPNENPELAVFPSPPGCLIFNRTTPLGDQLPMALPDGGKVFFAPEREIGSIAGHLIHPPDVFKCDQVFGRVITGDRTIVLGEKCVAKTVQCPEPVRINSTANCEIEEESTEFLEATGWHRTLGASLHADFRHVAFQWLPRQFFAEPDELTRKIPGKANSTSTDINIENPSMISPPQVVEVKAFPIPAHARVNPPARGQTHFTVYIPKAVWMVDEKVKNCAVERTRLADLLELPSSMRLGFAKGKLLVKTKTVKGGNYASTQIPTGDPEDLLGAVVTTAVTATVGALAIIISSLKK